jgi:hypothetical protein
MMQIGKMFMTAVVAVTAAIVSCTNRSSGPRVDKRDSESRCPAAASTMFFVINDSAHARTFIGSKGVTFDDMATMPANEAGCVVAAFRSHIAKLKSTGQDRDQVDVIVENAQRYFFECAGILKSQQRQYVCNVVDSRGRPPLRSRADRFTNFSGGGPSVIFMQLGSRFEVLDFSWNGDF